MCSVTVVAFSELCTIGPTKTVAMYTPYFSRIALTVCIAFKAH